MRFPLTIFSLLLVLMSCSLVAAEGVASREQIEKDLLLQATLTSPARIQTGELVRVSFVLRNRSRDVSYPVVMPGDGTESGWREPYVFFTAEVVNGDGVTTPVPRGGFGRCGLFDPNWQKQARVLKPGEELPLKDWVPEPSRMLEFQDPGHVRLVVHYRYGAGTAGRSASQGEVAGLMAGVPAFELVSAPVEFDVERPLDLVLQAKGTLPIKTPTRISGLLDIRLVNRSAEPMPVSSPTASADARISLEIQGQFPGWPPRFTEQKSTYGEKLSLKPGEEVAVIGSGPLANGMDGTWEYPVVDTIKVRACFRSSTRKIAPVIYSNWVEVRAMEVGGR